MSDAERVKTASRGLRGTLAAELENDAPQLSDDGQLLLKFHGSYQQEDRDQRRERKKAGLEPAYQFMTRSRVPGGVLTAEQYLVHDDLASRFANGTLRATTRQTIQLHGVVKGDLRPTIRALNDALVSTLATCGDVNRNVMGCPAPEQEGVRDAVRETARAISDALLPRTRAYHEIWIDGEQADPAAPAEPDPIYEDRYLPRKFKIAIALPDDNCTDVFANDLGFIAITRDAQLVGYNVLVGGGFGQTHGKAETFPRLADPLAFVTPADVIDVARAVILAQRDHGNRTDRKRARLKYVIEDRGLDWFRGEVEHRFGCALHDPAPISITHAHDHLGWHAQSDGVWYCGLFVQNGRIADTDTVALRAALRSIIRSVQPGVHLTPQQNVLLTNIPEAHRAHVERILREHGVPSVTQISSVRRGSMACPALPTCPLALAEAERALPSVIAELEPHLVRLGLAELPIAVRMTGCPNGCARPYTADLAFVGRSLDKYVVYAGGNMEGTRLAHRIADLVPRAHLVETVLPLFEQFAHERAPGESFGDFWSRRSVDAVPVAHGS